MARKRACCPRPARSRRASQDPPRGALRACLFGRRQRGRRNSYEWELRPMQSGSISSQPSSEGHLQYFPRPRRPAQSAPSACLLCFAMIGQVSTVPINTFPGRPSSLKCLTDTSGAGVPAAHIGHAGPLDERLQHHAHLLVRAPSCPPLPPSLKRAAEICLLAGSAPHLMLNKPTTLCL